MRVNKSRGDAMNALIEGAKDVYEAYSQSGEALNAIQGANNYRLEAKRSQEELTSTDTIDLESFELPESATDLLNKYQQTTNQDGSTSTYAPSYEVADQIHSARLKQLQKQGEEGLSTNEGRELYFKSIGQAQAETSAGVLGSTLEMRRESQAAGWDKVANQAILSQDPERAMLAYNTALRTGVMSAEEFAEKTAELPNAMDNAYFSESIATTDDTAELERLGVEVWSTKNSLTTEEKSAYARDIDQKQDDIDADDIKRKEKNDGVLLDAYYRGDINANQLRQMTREDGTHSGHMNVLRLTAETNVDGYFSKANKQELQTAVNNLPLSNDIEVGAAGVRRQVHMAQMEGKINGNDAKDLLGQLNDFVAGPFNTENYKSTVSDIRLEILQVAPAGGGFMGYKVADPAKHTANERFMEAKYDLRRFVEASGPSANAELWWQDNRERYTHDAWVDTQVRRSGMAIPKKDGAYDVYGYLDLIRTGPLEPHDQHTKFLELKRLSRQIGLKIDETTAPSKPVPTTTIKPGDNHGALRIGG